MDWFTPTERAVTDAMNALYDERPSDHSKLRYKTILELRDRAEAWLNTAGRRQEDGDRIVEHYRDLMGRPAPEMTVKVPDQGQAELKIGRGGRRKGAGRKATGKEQRKPSIRMDADRWSKIDAIQQAEGKTVSDTLAELLELALDIKLVEYMDIDGNLNFEEDKQDGKDGSR